MTNSSIPWHLQLGNPEKQIENVMSAVHALINGQTKKTKFKLSRF